MDNAIFIGATGQNVGKTTLCLGIISALMKRYSSVGFTKPVGQQHVEVEEGLKVDKDTVLFRKKFNLDAAWKDMSPVIIPSGFTRAYIDGKVSSKEMEESIVSGFERIQKNHAFTVVEGTGHLGVGSIIGLSNAKIASMLGLDMVIIATGGLGSAIDELALNVALCREYGVNIRGVILNRVYKDKSEMIREYVGKALQRWNIPLIGLVPFNKFLSTPTMSDFEALFNTKMIAGEEHRWRHCSEIRLVAASITAYEEEYNPNELIITPASRFNIIQKIIEFAHRGNPCMGLILTGRHHPTKEMIEGINRANLPAIYAPTNSYAAMKEITHLITKTRIEDTAKVDQAIELVEPHIDFEALTTPSRRPAL